MAAVTSEMSEEEGVEGGRGALIKEELWKKKKLVVGLRAKDKEHAMFQRSHSV